jgi:hypothetical protein
MMSLRTSCQRIVNSSIGMRCLQQKGWSPLRHSVESHSLITTNMLLERGADIDLRNGKGISLVTARTAEDARSPKGPHLRTRLICR